MTDTIRVTRNGLHVTRYAIRYNAIRTYDVYTVWAPSSLFGRHSTIMALYHDDRTFGRVGTERLPADLEALPSMTQIRADAVRAWQQDRYENAYRAIVECFPETASGKRSMGQISVGEPERDEDEDDCELLAAAC